MEKLKKNKDSKKKNLKKKKGSQNRTWKGKN